MDIAVRFNIPGGKVQYICHETKKKVKERKRRREIILKPISNDHDDGLPFFSFFFLDEDIFIILHIYYFRTRKTRNSLDSILALFFLSSIEQFVKIAAIPGYKVCSIVLKTNGVEEVYEKSCCWIKSKTFPVRQIILLFPSSAIISTSNLMTPRSLTHIITCNH